MTEFSNFYQIIAKNQLCRWLKTLPMQIAIWQSNSSNIKFQRWINIVQLLPEITPYKLDLLNSVTAQGRKSLSNEDKLLIKKSMYDLMPWRKGPFSLYDINIDAEWRSDLKWQRILPHLSNLTGRIVLDVGCGNSYYMWRMIGAGAHLVVGIDPIKLFFFQFKALHKLLGNDQRVHLIPLGIEQLPSIAAFDTVFSMGVLYHRISPLEHLYQLKDQLVSNGELVLETLVVDGDRNTILVPNNRYAQMRNIYFIPSLKALENWLEKCGFMNIRIVDVCVTTTKEQRSTEWMTGKSLVDFLDPQDVTRTIEGYPAPTRAVLIANKP